MLDDSHISHGEEMVLDTDNRVRGFESSQIGRYREQLFLHVWRNIWSLTEPPPWFVGVKDASYKQDRYDRTDAILVTSEGDISIQIKGKEIAIKKFRRRYSRRFPDLVAVLIHEDFTKERVIEETLKAVYERYPDLMDDVWKAKLEKERLASEQARAEKLRVREENLRKMHLAEEKRLWTRKVPSF